MKRKYEIYFTPNRTELFWGLGYLAFQILLLPALLDFCNSLLPSPLSDAKLNLLFFLLNFLAVCWIFRRILLDGLRVCLQIPFWVLQSAAIGLVLYQLCNYLMGILIVAVDPTFSNLNDASIAQMVSREYTVMAIGTIFLVPVAEEAFFRGMIFGSLYRRSRVAAYALSAAAFSALHLLSYLGSMDARILLLSFLQYIPAGLILGWAYARGGTLLTPILIHMSINALGIFAMR